MSYYYQVFVDRYIPSRVRGEIVIYTGLHTVLTWGMKKNESLDWELLTLGPKGGVPPPKPLLWTFGHNRVVVFGFIALLCMAPRLYMTSKAMMARGGNGNFGTKPWLSGLAWALIFYYPKMVFPLWVQWILFIYTYVNIAPPPTSIAGFECLALSVLACLFVLPPALVFAICRLADTVVHPLLRGNFDSGILQNEQGSVFWFLRFYVLLLIPQRKFPNFCAGFAFWSLCGSIFCLVVAYLVLLVVDNSRCSPESSCDSRSSLDSRREFSYAPLPSHSHIRLLKVLPSLRGSEKVTCQLIQVDLFDLHPKYNAISYHSVAARKDESEHPATEMISVNGFQYTVYPNVLAILKDVRSRFVPQYIWMNAICIDQRNVAEKQNQAAIVRDIYQGGSSVLVHLADAPCRDPYFLRHIIGNLRDSRVLQDFSAEDMDGKLLSLGTQTDWDALENVLDDPWFVDVWNVQQIAVARRIRFRIRGEDLEWGDFVRACASLSRTGMRSYIYYRYFLEGKTPPAERATNGRLAGVESTLILDNLRQWYASGQLLPLLDTMILCLRFKSTLEVDKLYALLGIVNVEDRDRLGITPDYTQEKAAVFRSLACQLLQSADLNDQFRVLRFAGIGQKRNMDELPSWVPDWTAGLPACLLVNHDDKSDYRASTTFGRRMRLRPSQESHSQPLRSGDCPSALLEIDGALIDRIVLLCDVSETPPPENTTDCPFGDALAAVKAHDPSRQTYGPTLQPIEEAFWRTMIANRYLRSRPAPDEELKLWTTYFLSYEAARSGRGREGIVPGMKQDQESWDLRRIFSAIWFKQSDDEDLRFAHLFARDLSRRWPEHRHVLGAMSVLNRPMDHMEGTDPRMSAGRQFCVTEKGYFGLVPRLTAIDDMVVLFDGSKTPHVARASGRWGGESGTAADGQEMPCKLVGECFIHEGMDGELEQGLDPDTSSKTFVLS